MTFEVYPTSAENIIGVTDACLQKPSGVDVALAADFLDTTQDYARDALLMACQLNLVQQQPSGVFVPASQCTVFLCTASRESKAAVLRYVLEQYEPYRTFKTRLALTGVVGEAATQSKALHQVGAHRQVVMTTFIDLGTYAQSLVSEGGGLYRPREDDPKSFLQILNKVMQDRATAELQVYRRMGAQAADWVDAQSVFSPIVTAYQRAGHSEQDPRAPIVHAGNAVESFLSQLAGHYGVNVQNAHGINAKVDALARANQLATKHKFILKYLGHVRNAADHGIDAEVGHEWDICQNTALEYVHVAQTIIANLVMRLNNRFVA